jgi:hypothetical protein
MNTKVNQPERSRNQRRWQAHVAQQIKSGLNRAEYCRQHSLSYHALTYWRRKLSKPMRPPERSLVPVTIRSSIQQMVEQQSASLRILLPGQATIEIGDDFLPATLNKLLDTFKARQCCQ